VPAVGELAGRAPGAELRLRQRPRRVGVGEHQSERELRAHLNVPPRLL
jgi:hypothetical protein